MTTQQAIYTVQEVARIVRVKPATVYRWISNGEMPHMRCGPGTVRVTGAQLQEYMDRCTHTASNAPQAATVSGTSVGQKAAAPTEKAPARAIAPPLSDSWKRLFESS